MSVQIETIQAVMLLIIDLAQSCFHNAYYICSMYIWIRLYITKVLV